MKIHIPYQICRLILICLFIFISAKAMAQHAEPYRRIARVTIDPVQLEAYIKALKIQMNTAIRAEKGVLSYYAVSDKKEPAHITIFEIYQSEQAYQSHIETAHFKTYKNAVKDMVRSLTLEDVREVASAKKPGV